ncbi:MAG TPA: NAD-dependent protein deacylase [Erysipelotrichaceae bacterium]|nr:NAD-dependent protein deacylase [Erysipelotrichaceae bacterium]HQB31756.1 NAD-dependent protein deacylase [Erysipelotrichaceae bacterium]
MEKIKTLQRILDESDKIVFFTGAGVSTESGIPDFRSVDGLYSQKYQYPPEAIISHSFYKYNPQEFYRFYKDRMIYPDAKPNMAHIKMAELESKGKAIGVITQNIDGLHQAAGSKNVYELHGSIHRNYCTKCHRFYDLDYIINSEGIPHCSCGGIIKPDVVLYEEGLDDATLYGAIGAIRQADCMVIAGTSLVVYPAAGLVNYFRGKYLVLINLSATSQDSAADLLIKAKVGEVFEKIVVQ